MKNTSHIIQKTLFNVKVPNAGSTKQVERFVNDLLPNKLKRELDTVLSKFSGLTDYICFDKINIDLGDIDLTTATEEDIVREICAQLSIFLEEQIAVRSVKPRKEQHNGAPGKTQPLHKEPLGHRAVSQFVFFLKNGFFPWNAMTHDLADLERLVITQLANNIALKKELTQALSSSPVCIRRMAVQTTEHFYISILNIFKLKPELYEQAFNHLELIAQTFPESKIPLSRLREVFISKMIHSEMDEQWTEEKIIEQVLHKVSADMHVTSMDILSPFMASFSSRSPADLTRQAAKTFKLLKAIKNRQPFANPNSQSIAKNTNIIHIPQGDVQKRLTNLQNKNLEINPIIPGQKLIDGEAFKLSHANRSQSPQLPSGVEEIYVADAGIAIIHPFFPALFKNLGVIENHGLANFSSRLKAVKLLGYICSGGDQIAENRLTIAKLLCGVEIQTPLDGDISLTATEKREVNQMLLAVIGHWTILKNTSIETFRESFINRSGILKHNPAEWLLSIEQKPFDLLFNYIPWNISMIHYSWMPTMMKVTISNTKT